MLRSVQTRFNFREHCLFCGQSALYDNKLRDNDVFPVRTGDFMITVLKECQTRNDSWSQIVQGRVASVNDLHAADARYHQQCSSNFRTGKNIPAKLSGVIEVSKKFKAGRPVADERYSAFMEVVKFIEEEEDEQFTINNLVTKMAEFLENTNHEAYGTQYMKTKLVQHFGDRIIITLLSTKVSVITLRETASSILYEFHKQKLNNSEEEKFCIIKTAAKLIQSDVKSINIKIKLLTHTL